MKAPPIGVKPRHLWLESRMYDLIGAIYRATKADATPNREWFEELRDLMNELCPRKYSISISSVADGTKADVLQRMLPGDISPTLPPSLPTSAQA